MNDSMLPGCVTPANWVAPHVENQRTPLQFPFDRRATIIRYSRFTIHSLTLDLVQMALGIETCAFWLEDRFVDV